MKSIFETFEEAVMMHDSIRTALPERSGYGLCFIICHDDEVVERDMTLEMGCMVETTSHAPVTLPGSSHLAPRQLPAVPMMATAVITGGLEVIHAGYGRLGLWVQNNGYRMTGTPREITLKASHSPSGHDLVTELQFPVELAG